MRDPDTIARRAVVVTSDLSYPAGGQVYARRMCDELLAAGWQLAVWTNAPQPAGLRADRWHVNETFFRDGHGITGRLRRRAAERELLDLVRAYDAKRVFVLSDVPRGVYRTLSRRRAKVTFFLHSATPTCPQQEGLRYLARSGTVCPHVAGMNCLKVDRVEGCLGRRPWWRKLQRIWNTRSGLRSLVGIETVVANSDYIAGVYRQHDGRIELKVLEPRVPAAQAADLAIADDARFTIVFLGRIEAYKGALEAVEILAKLPSQYRLKLIGEGSAGESLQRRAGELGIGNRVELTGWADRARISAEFRNAGVLVMPGLCAEAFGMAGPEALSAGVPVVAYDVGGVGEWCDGVAARAVPVGNRASAVREILDITSDVERWKSLRRAARTHAELRFDSEEWRKRFFEIVEPRRRSIPEIGVATPLREVAVAKP